MSAGLAATPWVPPEDLSDRLSPWLQRLVLGGSGLVAAVAATLALAAAWPAWRAAQEPEFQALREAIARDRGLRQFAGQPLELDSWPTRYASEGERRRYELTVRGPLAVVRVRGWVQGQSLVDLQLDPLPSPAARWNEAHPARPLPPRRRPDLGARTWFSFKR